MEDSVNDEADAELWKKAVISAANAVNSIVDLQNPEFTLYKLIDRHADLEAAEKQEAGKRR